MLSRFSQPVFVCVLLWVSLCLLPFILASHSPAAHSPENRLSLDSEAARDPGSITIKGERLSAKLKSLPGTNEPYESSNHKEIDASYLDPLGPQIERPKTAVKKRMDEDEFADEELGDDLLPE